CQIHRVDVPGSVADIPGPRVNRARYRSDPVSVGITGHFQMLPHYLDADAWHELRQIQPVKTLQELFDPALNLLPLVLELRTRLLRLPKLRINFLKTAPPLLQLLSQPRIFLPQLLGALDHRLHSFIQLLEDFK